MQVSTNFLLELCSHWTHIYEMQFLEEILVFLKLLTLIKIFVKLLQVEITYRLPFRFYMFYHCCLQGGFFLQMVQSGKV